MLETILDTIFEKRKHYYDIPKELFDVEVGCLAERFAIISHYVQSKESMPLSVKESCCLLKDLDTFYNARTCENSLFLGDLFSQVLNPIFPAKNPPKFTFIDLFAGIGGFRIAMQNLGGKCVFSSEWDKNAQKTYFANFGEVPFGDITKESVKNCIPDTFDVLCAGFPCQAFSIAGHRRGFEDTRGTLFFDIATILKKHRPKAFFLENVKNLKSHDGGKTFSIIEGVLKELGYAIFYSVLNTMEYTNIPQNRERIFIIGFDPKQVCDFAKFSFPNKIKLTRTIKDCIDYSCTDESLFYRKDSKYFPYLEEAMTDENTVYQWRRQYVRKNQSNVCPTLTANMGTGGHNVPLIITSQGFRKLSPRECLNFQGYPADYIFPAISKSMRYKQVGNSVTVPLVERVGKQIVDLL